MLKESTQKLESETISVFCFFKCNKPIQSWLPGLKMPDHYFEEHLIRFIMSIRYTSKSKCNCNKTGVQINRTWVKIVFN